MCGIIAVLRHKSRRKPPAKDELCQDLSAAAEALSQQAAVHQEERLQHLGQAADSLQRVNSALRGPAGVTCLLETPGLSRELETRLESLGQRILQLEEEIDSGLGLDANALELVNATLVRLKDAAWAIAKDRLRTAETIKELCGADPAELSASAIESFCSIAVALSALDRLEVRGRDSAGIHLLVTGHGLDLDSPELSEPRLKSGLENRLFTSKAIRTPGGNLCFVYKAAAEIGNLGDNSRALRQAIKEDRLLARALATEGAETTVLGHTRWASVGIISQANAHPVNQEEAGQDGPYVAAALNGDVDNFADLQASKGIRFPAEITTDAKVIPTLVSRRMAEGLEPVEAFRQTVASFEGSVAIGCSTAVQPDKLMLALRGSGQGVYVGLAEDAFVVASEPYGVVDETAIYLRLDGEKIGNPDNPTASQGQLLVLDRQHAGEIEGIHRMAYDGTVLPVARDELQTAEITTRDIDRGDHPHFLLKEISEAPRSFHKTLRGKIREEEGGLLSVQLGDETLPEEVRQKLRAGSYRRLIVIGQGTAAVAGQGVAAAMAEALAGPEIQVQALPATELSGFQLRDEMSDTLVVAISQSGTTTDTNRTVDLVRGRGATVLAIVNRRGSDLAHKADGVFYTSDGRDVEMSVASTKAFYSQIAAGTLLALALEQEIRPGARQEQQEILTALRTLPKAMETVLGQQEHIGQAARKHAPHRRHWAVVGNGKNRIAAEEIRIKLSELCYKSIACDATEDKKHIDLSCEPLILVCAAGLTGSTAVDVGKELEIYRAHKAAPILIASGTGGHPAALAVLTVPEVHPSLSFVLSTMAGHLFGYYAALAIDELAHPLRKIRAAIEQLISGTEVDVQQDPLHLLRPNIEANASHFFSTMAEGSYDGQLEASTAVRLSSYLGYALGTKPLESYQMEKGKVGTPGLIIEELTAALTRAIEELTRPVDAIKHQAKTVTVGISRSDEALLTVPLVKALLSAGAARGRLGYRDLRTLAALDAAVAEVWGATRYAIQKKNSTLEGATIKVVKQTGAAKDIPSRTGEDPRLRGSKHLVAEERQLWVARGRSDGRTVILVPEVQAGSATGLTLLHVRFHEHISAAAMRGVLGGYRNRYSALVDLVTETEPSFDEKLLERIPVADALTTPVHLLADRWKSG